MSSLGVPPRPATSKLNTVGQNKLIGSIIKSNENEPINISRLLEKLKAFNRTHDFNVVFDFCNMVPDSFSAEELNCGIGLVIEPSFKAIRKAPRVSVFSQALNACMYSSFVVRGPVLFPDYKSYVWVGSEAGINTAVVDIANCESDNLVVLITGKVSQDFHIPKLPSVPEFTVAKRIKFTDLHFNVEVAPLNEKEEDSNKEKEVGNGIYRGLQNVGDTSMDATATKEPEAEHSERGWQPK